jgi:hypothetical protein
VREKARYGPYTWESTIVPEIALVREAVADEPELAFLDVLLDGIDEVLFRYLTEK